MAVTKVAVCGLHLRGQALNHQLTELGATFVKMCKSSPQYRLFALPAKDGKPSKPGMIFSTQGGAAIALEIWQIQVEKFGFFVLKVPPPLAIGTVYLEDGDSCPGFIAEGHIANDPDCIEITEYGGWLNYKNSV